MAHVVAEPCFICESVDCVTVCPTDCFRQDEQMLYIHPDECIDCEACVPACPVEAIYHEDALRPEWRPYRDLNATLARQTSRVKLEATPRRARQATTTSFSA